MGLFESSEEGVVWYMEETPIIDEEQAITTEVKRDLEKMKRRKKKGGGGDKGRRV